MFQNITNNEETSYEEVKKSKAINIRNLFSVNDIIIYAITFMLSMVSFNGDLVPFGLAIFAAACSNRIPAGIVYIASALGTLIGFGFSGLATFVLTTIVFILLILIFSPIFQNDDRNEKQKLGIYIFMAVFIVQAVKMFFTGFLIYDLLLSFMQGIITYIFYKIFANSIGVIKDYGEKYVFSIEELIGACLMFSIALVSLNKLTFWGLSITNIFSIMIVLFLGWKKGVLVGGTAGITIGMVLGIITNSSPVLVASYAISGMIAGLLNKLGKIGVIAGFCLGNAILTYVANGNTVPIITIREILVASLGLLVIPKDIKIDIEEVMPQLKCFPVTAGILEGEKETVDKLNSVSETISDMARSYNAVATDALDEELEEESRRIFTEELLNNIEDIPDNFIYEDIIQNEDVIVEDIFKVLLDENELTKEKLLEILEKNNDYVFGDNEEDTLIKDLNEMVKIINSTYRVHKLNMMWKIKEANNKKVLATQLRRRFKGYFFTSR